MRWSRPEDAFESGDALPSQFEQALAVAARFAPMSVLVVLLLACWSLGGATQNNAPLVAILELLAILGVAIVFVCGGRVDLFKDGRTLAILAACFSLLILAQLVPLPWGLWSQLPGHANAAKAADLLDLPKSPHPLSLTPEHTISAALKFIPALAIYFVALALSWRMLFGIIQWAATVAGVLSSVLGFAQVVAGERLPLHLYAWGNTESATGLFANANHQAVFLLMCLPFIAVLGARALAGWRSGKYGLEVILLMAAAALIVIAGIAIAGSLSGYILTPLVVAGCAFLLPETVGRIDPKYLAGGLLLILGVIALALFSPQLSGAGQGNYFGGERARASIHAHSLEAAADFLPLGSGLGSFDRVYPFYEKTDVIEESFVNHAHNDYLEVLLELGLPGIVIVLAFLGWWSREAFGIWTQPAESLNFKRAKMAATLAIAVVLVHSLLEFSLRTIAISALVAACLAVMVRKRTARYATERTAVAIHNPSAGRYLDQ